MANELLTVGLPLYEPHRDAEVVLEHTPDYVAFHGLRQVLDDKKLLRGLSEVSVGISAFVGPELDREGFELTVDMCRFLFYFDAFADGEVYAALVKRAKARGEEPPPFSLPEAFTAMFSMYEDILANPDAQADLSNPFASMLNSVAVRIKKKSEPTPWQFAAWADAIRGYMGNVQLEMQYRNGELPPPNIHEYIAMRRGTAGVKVVLTMLGAAQGIQLTEAQWNDPLFQRSMALTTDIVGWLNDLNSRSTEQAEGRAGFDFVNVWQRVWGITADQARAGVKRRCKQKYLKLLEVEAILRQDEGNNQAILQHITGQKYWIGGYLRFADYLNERESQAETQSDEDANSVRYDSID